MFCRVLVLCYTQHMSTETVSKRLIGGFLVAATLGSVAYDHAQVLSEAKALAGSEFYRTPTARTSVNVLPRLDASSSEAATFAASSVLGAGQAGLPHRRVT